MRLRADSLHGDNFDIVPTQVAAVSMAVHAGATTVREVMDLTGYRSFSSTHAALKEAREMGLITWDPTLQSTLRTRLKEVTDVG